MIETQTAAGRPFTGWHMLMVMLAFFGVIIGVNVFMAVSAARTWTGLVVQNSYVASQEFNTKQANARAQQAMGWSGSLAYDGAALRFRLVDGTGLPLVPDPVIVAVSRPIGVEGDQTLVLEPLPDGSYAAAVDLKPGAWNALILAQFAEGADYEHHARLVVAD